MRELAFVLAGLVAGVFSGSLGVGGAIVTIPLIRFLGVPPFLAIGTVVPSILPSGIIGAWTYLRRGLVDKRAALWIAGSGAAFSVLGALTTRRVPGEGHLLMLITATILFVLALRLLPGRGQIEETEHPHHRAGGFFVLGTITGFLSGLLGVGGGFIMVPALVKFFGFRLKIAMGTSLGVISVMVIPNGVAHALVGNVDWKISALLIVGVVPGARIGALVAIRAPERKLRLAFGLILAAVALGYMAFEIAELS